MSYFRRRLMMAASAVAVETLHISIATNHSEGSVINGKRITVSYGSEQKVLTWSGKVIDLEVPAGNECTVSFEAIDKYRTPQPETFTTVKDGERTISGLYETEIVKVKVTSETGSTISGQLVTINGNGLYSNSLGEVSDKVPFGTRYNIVPGSREGYDVPESISRVAANPVYSTSISYTETASKYEVVNIDLTTNQPSDSDIYGTSVDVRYSGETKNLVWSGSRLSLQIPRGVSYTVDFGSNSFYRKPGSETHTAIGGNTRTISVTYETEVVRAELSASDGASVSGQSVTIDGYTTTVDYTGVATRKVPYGRSYTVRVSSKSGYTTPSEQSYTAGNSSRTVYFTYQEEVAQEETVYIDLSINQSDDNLNGTTVNINHGGSSDRYTWSGSRITATVPANEYYTVEFGSKYGYKRPGTVSYTAQAGNTRVIPGEYKAERLTVNVYTDDRASVSGQTVYIGGSGYNPDSQGDVKVYIPYDERVNISVSSKSGYTTPDSRSITGGEDGPKRTVFMQYIKEVQYERADVYLSTSDGSGVSGQTVYCNGESKTVGSDGYASFQIEYGTWYSVSVSSKSGYTTPSESAHVIAGQESRTFNMEYIKEVQYERLVVHVSTDDDTSTEGQTVFCNNYTEQVGSDGTATFNIKYGVSYTVSVNSKSGYKTPAALPSIVAGQSTRDVYMKYIKEEVINVGIMHTNGTVYSRSEWSYPNSEAVGVYVEADNLKFIISPENGGAMPWGAPGRTVTGITTTTDKATAKKDTNGYGNTSKIISQLMGYSSQGVTGSPAASYCYEYIFKNDARGILPSAAQWMAASKAKSEVDACMNKIGGDPMETYQYYWTSTQYDANTAWCAGWSGSLLGNEKIAKMSGYARAFAEVH